MELGVFILRPEGTLLQEHLVGVASLGAEEIALRAENKVLLQEGAAKAVATMHPERESR